MVLLSVKAYCTSGCFCIIRNSGANILFVGFFISQSDHNVHLSNSTSMAEQLKNYIIYGYSGREKRNNKEYLSIQVWRETKK